MATGHTRRIAPINQDLTRSGVSRFMHACKYTCIHEICQGLFCFSQGRRGSGRPRSQPVRDYCVLAAVVGLSAIL
jgi:hypothetical protein